MQKAVRPKDVLPDNEDEKIIAGITVRKGTFGAALSNASLLASPASRRSEREKAKKILMDLAPALVVLGVHEHVVWKNPDIQNIIEDAARNLKQGTPQNMVENNALLNGKTS